MRYWIALFALPAIVLAIGLALAVADDGSYAPPPVVEVEEVI